MAPRIPHSGEGSMTACSSFLPGFGTNVTRHNEEVDKNRYILSKLIDCVKFCGAFELALRGHDETEASENPGIFRGLVNFASSLDAALKEHLEGATVFRGTSKTIQNELLDCMLTVVKEYIHEEVTAADYIAIQADETSDVSVQCQLALVLRYIDRYNVIQERFFEFIPIENANAENIAQALLERMSALIPPKDKTKLIAQAYDGASVMRGATGGVQRKVMDVYENAHYVHCYAHQLNLVMQQATSKIPKVSVFFSELGGFCAFFSRSPKRTSVLDDVVGSRLPRACATRWNFHSRSVNTVYEHRDDLLKCFKTIQDSGNFDAVTVREAGGFVRMLEDGTFCFFLQLFHKIMPHVDMLFQQLQKRNIDPIFIKAAICNFADSIRNIRSSIFTVQEEIPAAKRQRTLGPAEQHRIAIEVCDTIWAQTKERFAFTGHLVSSTLLQGELFSQHAKTFPSAALNATVEAYPMLNKARLKTELSLVYENPEFEKCSGAVPLYQFFMENNLQCTFSETVNLLKILITTPMTSAESERCFSTLKRIKTFLRSTMSQERLNALAMLSMEKKIVKDMPNFNNKVIDRFATQKERRAKFLYK
ncbi:zinc finger MYM-type protein 1-like [Rhinichthys klamathensis goyatoka]|uniref:zinc finger MYM-type protein 1-like n=1 Tax=Rhinichthys klamathensis goyatoka TaxID=3034132 RepID=UPI0024B52785|nr:zinc finger MYM-type protein 1-like [Rhinichthys klamathensis goyatoka]